MADLEPGSVFAGHRIDGRAGKGGMGVVYRATDLPLDRPGALKLVAGELAQDSGFAERFKRESRLAASLDHPNVIPIYHAGEEDGRLFVTMRFVEGTDLAEVLRRDRRLAPERAVKIIAQVAAALDAAHAAGLVHRDVKPANILMQGDHVFLTDFGLSKQAGSGDDLTETGAVLGTVDYMAPEQVQGGIVDARSDVYALGCVLFQMLSGRVPFEKPNGMAKLFAHVSEPAPRVRDVPDALADVVQRAMEKDPGRRFQSAGDLAQGAASAIGLSAALPSAAPPSIRVRGPVHRRNRHLLGAALAAAAVATVAVLAASSGGGHTRRNADRAAITALLGRLHAGFTPAACRNDITQHGLDTYFAPRTGKAALRTCTYNSGGGPKRSILIYELKIAGETAKAVVDDQAQHTTFYLVKDHGRWKLDDMLFTPKLRYERSIQAVLSPSGKRIGRIDAFTAGRLRLSQVTVEPSETVTLATKIVSDLRHLKAPAGLGDVHLEVVDAFNTLARGAREALAAQQAHDATAFGQADRVLQDAQRKIGLALHDVETAQVS